jgi:hypothetical protein
MARAAKATRPLAPLTTAPPVESAGPDVVGAGPPEVAVATAVEVVPAGAEVGATDELPLTEVPGTGYVSVGATLDAGYDSTGEETGRESVGTAVELVTGYEPHADEPGSVMDALDSHVVDGTADQVDRMSDVTLGEGVGPRDSEEVAEDVPAGAEEDPPPVP